MQIHVNNTTGMELQMTKLLTLKELAALLERSEQTLKKDMRRNPNAVPPRVVIPGTRLLRWRESDVNEWLNRHVEVRHG